MSSAVKNKALACQKNSLTTAGFLTAKDKEGSRSMLRLTLCAGCDGHANDNTGS